MNQFSLKYKGGCLRKMDYNKAGKRQLWASNVLGWGNLEGLFIKSKDIYLLATRMLGHLRRKARSGP